jgi:predicted dehydrogenase
MSEPATKVTGVAIVGCGVIAKDYTKHARRHAGLRIVGFQDLDRARAEGLRAESGLEDARVFESLDEVLQDPAVDIVVNLTIHHAHYEVVKRAIEAGKDVYTEKPLAMTYREAKELVDLAAARGVRLASAPIVFLGEAQQTAMKMVRDGALGKVRAVYAEVNHSRIEVWHPQPMPFYEVGPLYDVGVYPLTILTALFGPAKRVSAYATTLMPDRVTKRGVPFHIDNYDYYVVNIEFPDGPVVRLSASFYVHHKTLGGEGIEFHGDTGNLLLHRWFERNARLSYAAFEQEYAEPVTLLREPDTSFDWGRALLDMSEAIHEGRPQRVTGAQAAHIVEILEASTISAREGRPVDLTSTFEVPAPYEWAQ